MNFFERLHNTIQTIRWYEAIRRFDNFYLFADSLEPHEAERVVRNLNERQSPTERRVWCVLSGMLQLLTGTLESIQLTDIKECLWGRGYLSLGPLARNASLWLVESDSELLDYPLPLLPHVIELSGVTTEEDYPKQSLPADMAHFIDGSKDVVIISFGMNKVDKYDN